MVAHKKDLQSLWNGKCSVFVKREKLNPYNKRTEFTEEMILCDISCKLSFGAFKPTNSGDVGAINSGYAKIFVSNDIEIEIGSKIVVSQNNTQYVFTNSGESKTYSNHKEIEVELFKEWA